MGEFRNSTIRYGELKNDRKDLLETCASGEYCGKGLEKYHNRCCDIETGARCSIAKLLDDNKSKMEGFGVK